MNFTLLVVVLLTAIAFVGIVIALSNAIAPRDRKSTRLNSSHITRSRMPSSA